VGIFGRIKKKVIDIKNMPEHVAFIMDGNGRWAKKRGMDRTFGHKVGFEKIEKIVRHASRMGVKIVSFYAFSTENWKRPQDEVDAIFKILTDNIDRFADEFYTSNIKFRVSGDISPLPEGLQKQVINATEKTKGNTGLIVNIALNYGSRVEIITAINKLIADGVKKVDEATFRRYLQTENLPDPDLVVRTSGELRLSNFMLYQCAYSELYFPKIFWPDFGEKEFDKAICVYQARTRRLGGI
jgi:undecaprenyl diphosphate synthase